MKIKLTIGGCTLTREDGDKRLNKESAVVTAMIKLLNAKGYNFKRSNPSKHGMTGCTSGLYDKNKNIYIWHGNYAVQFANEEFNKYKKIFFNRVP